jgi:hypothetical protein
MKIETILIQLVKEQAQQELEEIFKPENKEKFVSMVNDNVNIPLLKEKHEAVIFEALYDLVKEFATKFKK